MAKKSDKKKTAVEEFEYRAEMKQLLHLIVHSLYTHPEIFLRELISNASDALNKIRFRMLLDKNVVDPDADLRIMIHLDQKHQTFSIEDTGIGMNKEELINEIGTVAKSGTVEFLQKLQKDKQTLDGNLVGQFGVGFYSVFMVTDQVTIETRHADPDSQGYRWTSGGEGKFAIQNTEKEKRGTVISFKLKDEMKEFCEEYTVKSIIKKYSNFVDFPIFVGKEQVNRVTALWQKRKDDIKDDEVNEFYKFLTNDVHPPLGYLHLAIEGAVNFKALVFVPDTAPPFYMKTDLEKTLQLYSNKIFIQDNCQELLPEYLRFLRGVVDTEDAPLNISREWTQTSPIMAKIRNTLTGKILTFLDEWAKNETAKYRKFYRNFGPLFKTGVSTDFSNRERIIDLLRFESTATGEDELTSLREYVTKMKPDQKNIYYIGGEHRDIILKNPNLEYFRKHDIEVLLLTDPMDLFLVPTLHKYDEKEIKSIEKADIDLESGEAEEERLSENLTGSLIKVFKDVLGDRVADVLESKRLVESPVTLVSGKEAMDNQIEKMMKVLDKQFTGSKKTLEINTGHPLIKNLAGIILADEKDPLLRQCVLQLYESAVLIDGNLGSPAEFVRRMNEIMEKATARAPH
jgi:molecular chaperone HtpG